MCRLCVCVSCVDSLCNLTQTLIPWKEGPSECLPQTDDRDVVVGVVGTFS